MNKDLRTLIDCRNIWGWLAITGSDRKYSYPPALKFPFGCPCCENAGAELYGRDIWKDVYFDNRDCTKCLLCNIAWGIENNDPNESHCECEESFYAEWSIKYSKEARQYWAMRMVRACDTAIEQLIINS